MYEYEENQIASLEQRVEDLEMILARLLEHDRLAYMGGGRNYCEGSPADITWRLARKLMAE